MVRIPWVHLFTIFSPVIVTSLRTSKRRGKLEVLNLLGESALLLALRTALTEDALVKRAARFCQNGKVPTKSRENMLQQES